VEHTVVHGLIFFYIQKFAEVACTGTTSWVIARSNDNATTAQYLPSGVYPDAEAVELLEVIARSTGRPLPLILEQFGEFLAPHLLKVAAKYVDPGWRTLDLIERTESIIHSMIRNANPGAAPPVLETVRPSPDELHLVYGSSRQLCPMAKGLIRGLAMHFGDRITIDESSCMLRGDPFCSFILQLEEIDTHATRSPRVDTTVFLPAGAVAPPPSPAADVPHLPTTIGGYAIEGVIGHGGMGRVFLARDVALDREVAIKMLHPQRCRDRVARERFLREGRAMAAIDHPHVMAIHQVGEDHGQPFIVMQRLRGCTLREYCDSIERMTLPESLRIGREIAEGLGAAHRNGLVHRDIKPTNIFLQDPRRTVKIIDFGLAWGTAEGSGSSSITVDGAVLGTPAYMSPERIAGHEIDATSDLFGLGVVLYELLANRLPFDGISMVAVLAAISRGHPRELAEFAPHLPDDLTSLVMRMIAFDKADRPGDADTVAAELATIERSLA
jgi:tRNA A-37 threonylcarbamoyl transferase component Bud32